MAKNKKKSGSYIAKDISVLEGLEPVRKRPGMYIGSTGTQGLHHLIWEIFDNSRDEAMAGHADRIEVTLLPDGSVRVVDNGRGIPVDEHPKAKVSALEVIMTTLHAGGKFGGEGYKVSGGLHGVGASVVNALSTWTKVEVHRDGGLYVQEYERGDRKAKVKKIGKTKETGTIISFKPDPEIFDTLDFEWNKIISRLRRQSYLVSSMRVTVIDAREYEGEISEDHYFLDDANLNVPSITFYFEGGLVSLVKYLNEPFDAIHSNIFHIDKNYHDDEKDQDIEVEIAFQYVDDISYRLQSYANTIFTTDGGMHVTGFKSALTRTINSYARDNNYLKDKEDNFTGDDVLEGITAIVSVKLGEVQFEGQTKGKLGSVEARSATESIFGDALTLFLEENPSDAKSIIKKAALAKRARKAAKAAKDTVLRKGVLDGMTLPGKLADCQTRKASESELFIVEGDSAGGTAKTGRDRRTQAILPLRGKILNVERSRLDKMLSNEQIKNLVIAMGTAIGDTFDIDSLRYHKIIIATDADVDGAHIRTLLLTLFYRYFRPLIESENIFIAQPPLYKISQGKTEKYAYTEQGKIDILKELGVEVNEDDISDEEEVSDEVKESIKKSGKRVSIQRYKGLGEMNAEELWETTMDPEARLLKRVTIEDAQAADRIFDTLMGKDVSARKSFIQSNAKMATIDI